MDQAAEAVVLSADFFLDALEQNLPQRRSRRVLVAKHGGYAEAIDIKLVEGGFKVLGLFENLEGFGIGGGGLAELVDFGGGGEGHGDLAGFPAIVALSAEIVNDWM